MTHQAVLLTWLLGGLELSLVDESSGCFLSSHLSGRIPSVSVRVLALLTLKQGHCGDINDNLWRAKGNQRVMAECPGPAAAGSQPVQPGPGGEMRGSSLWTVEGACGYRRAAWQELGVLENHSHCQSKALQGRSREQTPQCLSLFALQFITRDGHWLKQTETRGQRSPTDSLCKSQCPKTQSKCRRVWKGEGRLASTRLHQAVRSPLPVAFIATVPCMACYFLSHVFKFKLG